jgi:hypothetical protein
VLFRPPWTLLDAQNEKESRSQNPGPGPRRRRLAACPAPVIAGLLPMPFAPMPSVAAGDADRSSESRHPGPGRVFGPDQGQVRNGGKLRPHLHRGAVIQRPEKFQRGFSPIRRPARCGRAREGASPHVSGAAVNAGGSADGLGGWPWRLSPPGPKGAPLSAAKNPAPASNGQNIESISRPRPAAFFQAPDARGP